MPKIADSPPERPKDAVERIAALEQQVAALRRQLSQAHIRLDWYAQFSGIPTPPWEQAIPEPPEEGA